MPAVFVQKSYTSFFIMGISNEDIHFWKERGKERVCGKREKSLWK
ncbi:hypothetical protein BRYFOR_05848 [Marvinbryantia formatexigens DSM 14469]|uniref:Uncharacterized protein n=1 Tax=Marvinbryantia formatexigens DSM 14469 TaxID=478749 RepID=C6LB53_9FIRM|nr:hypothetical protein BRYFOR_05848 [Marvinbryantia formatexigens DSM 14469]